MFTIKYRSYRRAMSQPAEGPTHFDACEQLHGPFTLISQEMEDGDLVVYAHNGDDPGMTFGPHKSLDQMAGESTPRPTLWVMNDRGATVARYDL